MIHSFFTGPFNKYKVWDLNTRWNSPSYEGSGSGLWVCQKQSHSGLKYECKHLSQWRSRVSAPKVDRAVKVWRLPTSESWAPGKATHLCNSSCFIQPDLSTLAPCAVHCNRAKLHPLMSLFASLKMHLPLLSKCWIWLMMEPGCLHFTACLLPDCTLEFLLIKGILVNPSLSCVHLWSVLFPRIPNSLGAPLGS